MKKAYWIGALVVVGFLALGLSTFTKSMTPYVSFDEAKSSSGPCRVMGGLEKGTSRYDTDTKTLHFTLVDPSRRPPSRRLPRREAGELRGGRSRSSPSAATRTGRSRRRSSS